MRASLSAMLSDAVDDGIIVANPALQLGRRKANRADKLTSAERLQNVRPMTWEQRDAFLDAAASERQYSALFVLLVKAGLRPSEAFALKPGDVDWNGTDGRSGSSVPGTAAGRSPRRPTRRARSI